MPWKVAPVPLGRMERTNLVAVLVLTQALQTLLFAGVTFIFFVVFGKIALTEEVIKNWTGRAPTPGTLFQIPVPIPDGLIHVSMFIAAFSAMYFAVSTVTDPKYRTSFFEPISEHLAASLYARDLYLSAIRRDQPTRPLPNRNQMATG